MKPAVLILLLALSCAGALAQPTNFVRGAGVQSCGTYIEARKLSNTSIDSAFGQWVMGYLSGHNMFPSNHQAIKIPDQPTVLAYVDKFCREQPLGDVSMAALLLVGELGGFPAPERKKP